MRRDGQSEGDRQLIVSTCSIEQGNNARAIEWEDSLVTLHSWTVLFLTMTLSHISSPSAPSPFPLLKVHTSSVYRDMLLVAVLKSTQKSSKPSSQGWWS